MISEKRVKTDNFAQALFINLLLKYGLHMLYYFNDNLNMLNKMI